MPSIRTMALAASHTWREPTWRNGRDPSELRIRLWSTTPSHAARNKGGMPPRAKRVQKHVLTVYRLSCSRGPGSGPKVKQRIKRMVDNFPIKRSRENNQHQTSKIGGRWPKGWQGTTALTCLQKRKTNTLHAKISLEDTTITTHNKGENRWRAIDESLICYLTMRSVARNWRQNLRRCCWGLLLGQTYKMGWRQGMVSVILLIKCQTVHNKKIIRVKSQNWSPVIRSFMR